MTIILLNKTSQSNSVGQPSTSQLCMRFGLLVSVPASIAALLTTACAESLEDVGDTATSESAVINGYIASPFELGKHPVEAKAVIDIGGCGGTLVDPQWVLTARHCGAVEGGAVTSHRLQGPEVRTIDLVRDKSDTDARLLHLSQPFSDIPSALRKRYADPNMIGQSVSVYGWGGVDTAGTCSSQADCPVGYGCHEGVCGKNNGAQLRYGDGLVVERAATSCRGGTPRLCFDYRANDLGQLTLFGDSGGPVFRDGTLAGIVSTLSNGGTPNAYASAVGVYNIRDWIDQEIAAVPPTIDKTITRGTAPSVALAGNGWRVNGVGDFDGDGHLDLVTRPANNIGAVHNLLMNADGTVKTDVVLTSYLDASWQIYGVGDFDADGRSDLVWRRADDTSEPRIWFMGANGNTRAEGDAGLLILQAGWRIYGIGDFNGDGRSDLVVRPTNGSVGGQIWMQRDGAVLNKVTLPNVGPEWQINGVGDFNGDGRSDLVWRRAADTGEARIWLMHNGYAFEDLGVPHNGWAGDGWRINGVGDFNGDGTSDLVWRRTTDDAEPQIWVIKQGKLVGGGGLPHVSAPWRIVATGDFDGDRKADLVWNRMDDGADASLWHLNASP